VSSIPVMALLGNSFGQAAYSNVPLVTEQYKLVAGLQGVVEVTAGLVESNDSLPLGLWRDSFHVICRLTACTLGSAPCPMLDSKYGRTLPF